MTRPPSTMSLVCFETSARLLSFTRAADALHLTQAAVSRQVLGLELRLGVQLFDRSRKTLSLTSAGKAYLRDVQPLLLRLERATTEIQTSQGRGGYLTVSVASSFGNYWLLPRLPQFTKAHPEITLNLETRVGPVDFYASNVDVSLEFCNGERDNVISYFIKPLMLSPYASRELARKSRFAGLPQRDDVLIRHSTLPTAWQDWFSARGDAKKIPREDGPRFELMSMALNACIAGVGIALLPTFMTEEAVNDKKIIRLSKHEMQTSHAYYLVHPKSKPISTQVETFVAWINTQA
jgi:LysR family transcriptional regulator, glycine cleavage system transcriptional activator